MGTKTIFQRWGARRLLKLADILDVADAEHRKKGEPRYDQGMLAHRCGTPACALGHWAFQNRRRGWELRDGSPLLQGRPAGTWATAAEFGISSVEDAQLFSSFGCGRASTAKAAARYIRKFVANKLKSAV